MYASQTDITALYGDAALYVAERPSDGLVDDAAVTAALASASREIDTFLATRYDLPLPIQPPELVQPAVDIALYRLASTRQLLSEDMKERFKDALAMLKRLSRGEQELVLPRPEPVEGETSLDGPNPIVVEGAPRLFDRKTMRGL